PYAGRWVVDNFGAEGGWLRGVGDARCGVAPLSCTYGCRTSVPLELEEGMPLVAESEIVIGENGGARIHRVNISPRVPAEVGADCLDAADNDADGAADCADPDCQTAPECSTPLCAD